MAKFLSAMTQQSTTLAAQFGLAVRSYIQGPFTNLKDPALARLFSAGARTTSGVVVNDTTAFMVAAVYDAVNQQSSDVAKMPLSLLKRTAGGGSEPYYGSKTYRLLKSEPNPEMGSMVFRRTITAHALTCKGGFAEIERDGSDRPVALWILTPDRVEPIRDKLPNGKLGPLVYRIDGKTMLEARNVIHIQGLGYDGINAYPVITYARQAIGLALAAEQFGAAFFGNGSTYGGVLSATDRDFDDEQAAQLQAKIAAVHGGADRAWKMLVLGAGFKYDRLGITPSESQMSELRTDQVVEVARFFGMPLHRLKVAKPGAMSYASVEAADLEYFKGPILSWTTLWEEELNRKVISPLEYRSQYVKHNANAFLRGDIKSRYDALAIALDRGVINANEWRDLEDMNPQEGEQGNIYVLQGAMVPKSKLVEITDARIAKDKMPKAAPAGPSNTNDAAVAAANARAAQAEQLANEAREREQVVRATLAAEEASGTASRLELDLRREEVTRAMQTASTLEQISVFVQQKAEALQAERSALEEELRAQAIATAVAETARHEAEELATAVAVEVKVAREERDQRRVEASEARVAADVARTGAAAAERRAQEAIAAREGDTAGMSGQISAHRELVITTMRRALDREADRVRRGQATPQKLRHVIETFYEGHQDLMHKMLSPVVKVHLAFLQSVDDPDELTRRLVAEHVATSQRQLFTLLDDCEFQDLGPSVTALLNRWDERAVVIADLLMKRELRYAGVSGQFNAK